MTRSVNDPASRNLALDFFRGLALLIIFINHVPANELQLFTPSRFGLSDAAEIFVFLSGYAAAMAYGQCFDTASFALGTFRVFHRCAQIYAAHLVLFGLMAMTCVLGNGLLDTRDYITHLNIRYFFDDTEVALRHLMALRYVPNYFDILPMYLVIMLWIPALIAAARLHRLLAVALPIAIYVSMWAFELEFPADPVGDRPWFFNPFGWQLIFFIGFALGAGWLRCPAPRRWLFGASLAIVLLSLPLGPEPGLRPNAFLQELHAALLPWLEKTRFGPLRLLHFLALAYLASRAVDGRRQACLQQHRLARLIVQIGQHSLPIFMFSMVLSYVGGMVFDQMGHHWLSIAAINLGGMALLMLSGHALVWFKSSPWKGMGRRVRAAADGVAEEFALASWPWRRWLRDGATLTLVLAVGAGPVLLSGRRSVAAVGPATRDTAGAWATADLTLADTAVPLPESEP